MKKGIGNNFPRRSREFAPQKLFNGLIVLGHKWCNYFLIMNVNNGLHCVYKL